MTIADYICQYLAQYQFKYIYGYPGASIVPLISATQKTDNLEWILMRSEYAAALAASAQAKLTNTLSVCMATAGPGATNLLTGLLDAELDRAPVLAITGLIQTCKQSLSSFQDVDQIHIFKSCLAFNAVCEHPLQIPKLLESAIGYVIKNRRVAHIAIANDIQQLEITTVIKKELQRKLTLLPPPDAAIEMIAETLDTAADIIIAVGPRARSAGCAIEQLSLNLQAPIVCSFAAKGIINEAHPNYFGVLGLYGAPANAKAWNAIKFAKLVLAFGIDDINYFLDLPANQQRGLIECEPDISTINYQYLQRRRTLLGRLDYIAHQLAQRAKPQNNKFLKKITQECQKISPPSLKTKQQTVHPIAFLKKLNKYIDVEKSITAVDIGDHAVWAMQYLQLTHYQKTVVSSKIGTMGFCLPALIAAKLSYPDYLVVGICGDGGLQMVLAEINTAVQYQVNIFLIVFNNNILQRVVAQQHNTYGLTLINPDYVLLAESCGAVGIRIDNTDVIDTKLSEAFSIQDRVVLIDVKCDADVFAPMISYDSL